MLLCSCMVVHFSGSIWLSLMLMFEKYNYSPDKAMWQIPILIIAYKIIYIPFENNFISKLLLFRMKDAIDLSCLFDDCCILLLSLSQTVYEVIHIYQSNYLFLMSSNL